MSDSTDVWEVFIQSKNGLAHKHVGSVHATDKELALQNARDLYTRRNEGSCIWVVKSEYIVSSESEDGEAFFDVDIFTTSPFLNIDCIGLSLPFISHATAVSPICV